MGSIPRLYSNPRSWLLDSDLVPHGEVYVEYLKVGQYENTTINTYIALAMKERTLAEFQKPNCKIRLNRAPHTLLKFLQTL